MRIQWAEPSAEIRMSLALGCDHSVTDDGIPPFEQRASIAAVPVTAAPNGGFLAVAENGWVSGNLLTK
jgi:hypothetical protein